MIRMTLHRGSFAAIFLITTLGCEKPEATVAPAEVTPAAASEPVATAPVTTTVQVDPETLPAEEDYEEEAEATITSANLEKQLELMEKELLEH